jgi:hypothetical protein
VAYGLERPAAPTAETLVFDSLHLGTVQQSTCHSGNAIPFAASLIPRITSFVTGSVPGRYGMTRSRAFRDQA